MDLKVFSVNATVITLLFVLFSCLCCQVALANWESQKNSLVLVPTESSDEDGKVENESPAEPTNSELFIPTEEWQTIKPGQAIPRGLHVRVNLETGEREAKLMELEKSRDQSEVRQSFNDWSHAKKGAKSFNVEQLKWALKNMKEDMSESAKEEPVREGLRTYAELKKDFEAMNAGMKTDLEILRELISEYQLARCSDERKLEILSDLEYYVHQIDNAQNFVDMGGLELVKIGLNRTAVEFRIASAFLVGSAAQSNPKVQVGAVDAGILHQIVRQLPIETDQVAVRRLLYALSAVLRHFPYAQKKFIELGGTEIFAQILSLESTDSTMKQKIKIVTLMADLLAEHEAAEAVSRQEQTVGIVNTASHDRLRQYRQIPLRAELREKRCCSLVAKLLPIASEYDSQEKILNTLQLLTPHCHADFPTVTRDSVSLLKSRYEAELTQSDPDDMEFLNNLRKTAEDIISRLPVKTEL